MAGAGSCSSCHQLAGRPHTEYCPTKEEFVSDVERRQCAFGACSNEATHLPCCSSHGHPLCCECYCHTHFVETGVCQCQPPAPVSRSLTEALEALEMEDPEVAAASASYDRMVDSIIGRGPAPPSDEVRRIYDTPAVSD